METNVTIKMGDSTVLLKELEDNSIDCIITDPPYPTISGGTPDNPYVNRPSGMLEKNDGKIFDFNNLEISSWIGDCYRVLKNDSHIYIMTNFLNLQSYMKEIESAGFQLHNLLIWKKNNATPNRWYMKNAEYIIFARKGRAKPIRYMGSKTVLEFDNVKNKTHPTEKPVSLLEHLILNSTLPNQVVLDPFGGSGSIIEACVINQRDVIAFEIDPDYYTIMHDRLASLSDKDIKEKDVIAVTLTPYQEAIYDVLSEYPDQDFTAQDIANLTNIPVKTCSGCFTPLISAGLAIKTNTHSPFKIKKRPE